MNRSMIQELVVAGCLLVGTLVVLFILIPTQIEQAAQYDLASLSPAFFPELAALIILGLTVVLIITHANRARKGLPSIHADEESLSGREELRVVGAMLISIAYYLSLGYLGFWIVNTAGVAALFTLQDRSRIGRHLIVALVTTVLIYAFFHYVMRVHFPIGEIFE
jgi:hypothetical protein